jgi:hypothetical protein
MTLNLYKIWGAVKKEDKYFNPDPMKMHPGVVFVVGKRGRGKSNAVMNYMIPRAEFVSQPMCFHSAILFRGRGSEDFLYDMLAEKMGDRFEIQNIDEIREWADAKESEARSGQELPQVCVIIDDWIGKKKIRDTVTTLPTFSRKWNLTLIILTQSFAECPTIMRRQCTMMLLMPGLTPRDFQCIIPFLPDTGVSNQAFKSMYFDATNGGDITNFMSIDLSMEGKQKGLVFRKGLYEPFRYTNIQDYSLATEAEENTSRPMKKTGKLAEARQEYLKASGRLKNKIANH